MKKIVIFFMLAIITFSIVSCGSIHETIGNISFDIPKGFEKEDLTPDSEKDYKTAVRYIKDNQQVAITILDYNHPAISNKTALEAKEEMIYHLKYEDPTLITGLGEGSTEVDGAAAKMLTFTRDSSLLPENGNPIIEDHTQVLFEKDNILYIFSTTYPPSNDSPKYFKKLLGSIKFNK